MQVPPPSIYSRSWGGNGAETTLESKQSETGEQARDRGCRGAEAAGSRWETEVSGGQVGAEAMEGRKGA